MDWTPKTDDELAREGLLQPGTYPAEIQNLEEREDKKGRPFLMLEMAVYGDDREGKVWDNVSPHWFAFKFKHLFESLGKPDLYEKGTMPQADLGDLVHAPLTVEIGIQGETKGDDGKVYPPKNIVTDYVSGEVAAAKKRAPQAIAELAKDSDLPFAFVPPFLIPFLVAFLGIGAMLGA